MGGFTALDARFAARRGCFARCGRFTGATFSAGGGACSVTGDGSTLTGAGAADGISGGLLCRCGHATISAITASAAAARAMLSHLNRSMEPLGRDWDGLAPLLQWPPPSGRTRHGRSQADI
jgi:hypothetical protein